MSHYSLKEYSTNLALHSYNIVRLTVEVFFFI